MESLGWRDAKSVLFPQMDRRAKGKGASEMEGGWIETISPERASFFPTLLQLSLEGKGFGSSLPTCRPETVKGKKSCGCRWVGVPAQGWGLP